MLNKLLCWLVGHKWILTYDGNNNQVAICKRCLKAVEFYDEPPKKTKKGK